MMLFRDEFPEFATDKKVLKHTIKKRVGLIKTAKDFDEMVDVMTNMIDAVLDQEHEDMKAALIEAMRWSRDLK